MEHQEYESPDWTPLSFSANGGSASGTGRGLPAFSQGKTMGSIPVPGIPETLRSCPAGLIRRGTIEAFASFCETRVEFCLRKTVRN